MTSSHTTCESGVHVHPCSAMVQGRCTNGFPVRRGCMPAHVVSPSGREKWYAATPPCCDEDFVPDEKQTVDCDVCAKRPSTRTILVTGIQTRVCEECAQ